MGVLAPLESSSLSQRASSSTAVTVRAGTSKCHLACRCLPPAGKVEDDGPGALVVTGGVPLHDGRVDAPAREALANPRGEGRRRALGAAPAAQRDGAGQPGDVLALGQDRALVAADLLDRPPRALSDLLGGRAGTDQGLDLAGAHAAVHFDLELAQTGAVPSGGSAEGLVEGDAEAVALGVGEQQMLPVLVDTDQSQVLHWPLPYRHTGD